jgi:hypothetical protein
LVVFDSEFLDSVAFVVVTAIDLVWVGLDFSRTSFLSFTIPAGDLVGGVLLFFQKAKKKQLKAASRANSYGVMSKVIKRHKKANPWLNRDVLNNYKRRLSRKKLSVLMPMVHLYHL